MVELAGPKSPLCTKRDALSWLTPSPLAVGESPAGRCAKRGKMQILISDLRRNIGRALIASVLVGLSLLLTTNSAAPQIASMSYRVAPGDRVNIVVFGQPDLSGEFMIDGMGDVVLPLIGEVRLGALTVKELEQTITKALSEGFFQNPVVNVRVIDFRPVYVVGDVRSPGSYPYRHGMTALSAIALAGGFGIPEPLQTSARVDFLAADQRVKAFEASSAALRIRRARLEAQRDGATDFDVPRATEAGDDDQILSIIANEQNLFTALTRGHMRELELLREQIPRLYAEISSVREQSLHETTQLKLIQNHLEDFTKLMNSGLARRYTGIELQREEARNKSNIARFAAELARLELSIGDVELKILQAENEYRRQVLSQLQESEARLQEIASSLPGAYEIREAHFQRGGVTLEMSLGRSQPTVVVHRNDGREQQVIAGSEATALLPGDVVEVRRSAAAKATAASRFVPLEPAWSQAPRQIERTSGAHFLSTTVEPAHVVRVPRVSSCMDQCQSVYSIQLGRAYVGPIGLLRD
jgi:polysaccharide export outer membrane protein